MIAIQKPGDARVCRYGSTAIIVCVCVCGGGGGEKGSSQSDTAAFN